jgi:hypothetical protein
MNGRMLMSIGIIIVSISVFITFVATFASAALSNFTINETPGNTTDNRNSTNTSSESLTLGGLSPQGESDLSVACSMLPERC